MSRHYLIFLMSAVFLVGCHPHPHSAPAPVHTTAQASAATKSAAPATHPAANFSAEKYRVVNEPGEIVAVLQNGATVITKHVDSPVVAMRGYTYTGGVYEGRWLGGGLSHLLEHLVAGGSDSRRTEQQNEDLLQQMGNDSDAYTTDDHTAFFVNTTLPHMEQAVDLVTGWMLGALITPEEFKREHQVVQRELEMDAGDPGWVFQDMVQFNRYRVSPARVPTIGYEPVIQGLSRDDVYSYYKMAYQPNNLVFSIVGNASPEKMLKLVQKYVGGSPPGREFSRDIAGEPPVVAPRTVVATFPKLGQARLELAFPSVRLTDPDLYVLDLLAQIAGGGESSVLVESIRDKQQLVSSISAADSTPSYVEGSFQIDMELDAAKIPAATKAVLAEIDKLAAAPIDAARIDAAKTQLRTQHIKAMQTSEDIAEDLATSYMFTGDIHFNDRYVERISQISAEQLQAAARKYLDHQKLITTCLLPREYVGAAGMPKAEDLLRAAAPTTKPATQSTENAVTRVELENGTVLIHKRITTTPLVTINLYSLGGVSAEDAKNNGIGNLTMEMLQRGTTHRSAEQIAEFFDSIGGDLNTSCGNNTWSWTATCMKDDFGKAFEVYADVVNNPAFDASQLKRMKDRVDAEIDSEDADWEQQSLRFFKQQYYGPLNEPYQFLAHGSKKNIASFSAEDLRKWYTNKVLGSRRVLAIYGDIDLAQAQTMAATYFGGGPKAPAAPALQYAAEAPTTKPSTPFIDVQRVEVNQTDQPLAGIIIGFNSKSIIGDPANFPITVADTMCSGYGYPTGYLFDTLRGQGLVYVVDAQNSPGRSAQMPGTFIVLAGCDPEKVNDVIDLILVNIARLQGSDQDLNVDWFKRSRQLITTSDAMSDETADAQATQAATDELFGLGYDYHRHFAARINAVTLAQVQGIARERLHDCVVTVSTPRPELVNVQTGKREYSSFPPVDLTPRGVQHDSRGGSQ